MLRVLCLLAVSIGVFSTHAVIAQEKENPIETEVKASLKDPSKPFTLVVIVKVRNDAEEKFEKAFAKARIATRKEKGNLVYDLNRATKAPATYLVYERWQDFPALQAHLKAPHFATLISEIGDLVTGPPEAKVLVPAGE